MLFHIMRCAIHCEIRSGTVSQWRGCNVIGLRLIGNDDISGRGNFRPDHLSELHDNYVQLLLILPRDACEDAL